VRTAGTHDRCNSIHPGGILTPMWDRILGSGSDRESRIAALVKDTPLQSFWDAGGSRADGHLSGFRSRTDFWPIRMIATASWRRIAPCEVIAPAAGGD
jgi:NAD(P)-dependent dehydrogenase (short-subunit alcohol dehydrogenase family)